MTGDSKTIFSVFYGRSNETLSLLAARQRRRRRPPHRRCSGTRRPTSSSCSRPRAARAAIRSTSTPTTPHADEVTFVLRREIFKDSVASVDYTYKRISNIWDGVEINQIWNPAGTNVVGYVNGMPQQIFRYTTPDGNYRIYQGIDFVFESRPSRNLDLYAAYTLSWLYGPGAEELGQISGSEAGNSQYYNPRQAVFFDGFLPEDVRHALKLRASYTWGGLVVGAFMRYQSGSPLSKRFFSPYDGDLHAASIATGHRARRRQQRQRDRRIPDARHHGGRRARRLRFPRTFDARRASSPHVDRRSVQPLRSRQRRSGSRRAICALSAR